MESCLYTITASSPVNVTVCVNGSTNANPIILLIWAMIITMTAVIALSIELLMLWYVLMRHMRRNSTDRRLDSNNGKISRVCNEDSTKIIKELPRDGNPPKYPGNVDECKQIVISKIQKELEQQWVTKKIAS